MIVEGFTNVEIADILLQPPLKQCDAMKCNIIMVGVNCNVLMIFSAPVLIGEKVLEGWMEDADWLSGVWTRVF